MAEETNSRQETERISHSLWRNRDYLIFWVAGAVSALGSQASGLALPLLILAITGSPAQAGLLGALRAAPYLLFSLLAGSLVDRWDRKRVMVLCEAGRALALGSIPAALALGQLTSAHLYIVTFIEGSLHIFFITTDMPVLRRVVPTPQLTRAVAQNQAAIAASGLLGPALGGALFSISRALPFALDALSYAVSVVGLLCIRTHLQEDRPVVHSPLREAISAGMHWIRAEPVVYHLLWLNAGINFLYGGWTLLVIALAHRLGASDFIVGCIFASGGAGAISGALLTPHLQRHFRVGSLMVTFAWLFAAMWPWYAVAPTTLALGVVHALIFIAVPIYNGIQFSVRLLRVPDTLQGRVNSVVRLVTFVCQALGILLMGALLERYGPVATVWLLLAPQLALALFATLSGPLRRAGHLR